MRAYKNRNNKTDRRCSYCGGKDHQVTACPHAEREWLMWESHRVPITHDKALHYPWYDWHRQDYTRWHNNAWTATQKIRRSREREQLKAAGKLTRASGTGRKCGFCGQTGHTRRNCPDMEKVKREALQANQNWRRSLYEEFVKKRGLCEGAAIKVSHRPNWNKPEEAIGLVTSVNWNDVNFLTSGTRVDYDYQELLEIKVLIGGETKTLRFSEEIRDSAGRLLLHTRHGYYASCNLIEVIGRSEKELEESWVTDGLADEFDWLTKKRTQKKLSEYGILGAIETWK